MSTSTRTSVVLVKAATLTAFAEPSIRRPKNQFTAAHAAVRLHHCFALRIRADSQESRVAYDKAIELGGHIAETAYLTRRRDQLA